MITKRIFKKIFLFGISVALFSTFISLLAGEFIVKHIMPQETYQLARVVGLHIFDESPVIPYTLEKNVNKFLHISFTREFTHYVSTNSYGIRGKEFSMDKPSDTYRILFLGDSMTFGWGVEDDKVYPLLIENSLNQALSPKSKYKKIEVINAGFTDAHSPDSYYSYFKEIGSKFNPDMVIVNFFPYNDIPDMFYNSWEKVDNSGYPAKVVSKTEKVVRGYRVSRHKTNWKYEIPILRNSHLGILFFNALERGAPSVVEQIKKIVGISKEKEPFSREEASKCVYSVDQNQCPVDLWPYFEKANFILKGLHDTVQNDNRKFLITMMISPDQAIPLSERGDRSAILNTIQPQKYFREFFEREKITYLDLLYSQSQDNAKGNFFHQDGHINEYGHRLVAQTITDFLTKTYPELSVPPL